MLAAYLLRGSFKSRGVYSMGWLWLRLWWVRRVCLALVVHPRGVLCHGLRGPCNGRLRWSPNLIVKSFV